MAQLFQIGSFIISPDLNRIEDPVSIAPPTQVEPKIMDVLVCLHDAVGEVVSREQILEQVWGETIVGDDVLTRAVGHLRKTLGDDPRQPQFIETIPRRGYRLLADSVSIPDQPTFVPEAKTESSGTGNKKHFRRLVAIIFILLAATLSTVVFQQRLAIANRVVVPTRVFPVTSFAGKEVDPAVSPDGLQVAFSARLSETGPYNIHITDLESGQTRQLTFADANCQHPEWSPDGLSIAYTSEGKNCGFMVIPAEGGIPNLITPCGHFSEHTMAWTNDSKSIIFAHEDDPSSTTSLVIFELATGATRQLTHPSADHAGDFDPAVSPLGDTVAFIRVRTNGAQDIHIVPLAGGTVERLTFDNQALTGLDWTENGQHIIYSSQRAGLFSLWRISAEGGLPQLVLGGGNKIKDPSTADRVSMVAYENWIYETNIWRLPLLTPEEGQIRKPVRLIHSTQWDLQPTFSPDGRSVAFVSTRSGGWQVWLAEADGGHPRRLTNFADSRVGSPSWSPDGTRLAFTVLVDGQSDIFVIPVDGGDEFNVTNNPLDELSPSWSANNDRIYFTSRRSGNWEVWQVALEDGELIQITDSGGLVARESLDGKNLYFNRSGLHGLWEMPLSGGQPRQVLTDLSLWDHGNWAVAETGIFYVDQDSTGARGLSFWERTTGQTMRLVSADSLSGQGISVSPDGRWLAFSRFDRAECDIFAAEGLR